MFRLSLLLISALVLSLVVFAGCASIIHGTSQEIAFQSVPDNATVVVEDAMGKQYGSCQTPCSLELKRKHEYKVHITKAGYETATIVMDRKSDGWIWGNIVFGGLIGVIVDFSNGAAYKLAPSELTVSLQKSPIGKRFEAEDSPAMVFFDIDEFSPEEQAEIAKYPKIDLSLFQ